MRNSAGQPVLGWHRLGRCGRRRAAGNGVSQPCSAFGKPDPTSRRPPRHPPPPGHNPTHLPQATNRPHLPQAPTPSPRPSQELPRGREVIRASRFALLIPPPPPPRLHLLPFGARRETAKLFALRGARCAKLGALASPRPQPAGQGLQGAHPIGTARCAGKKQRFYFPGEPQKSPSLPSLSIAAVLAQPSRTVHFT